jgi:histidyl-tRNA synthetase
MMIQKVKGTQDFLDMSLLSYLVAKVKAQSERYQFTEIMLPLIEHIELFKRSLGTHTDVISKEMFIIAPHEGEADLCLRPEMTASTVRAFIENGIQRTPWRTFSWGPVFRYERPQKGRYRQFHQFNFEIIGAPSAYHDIELLVLLDSLFKDQLNITEYALHINFLGTPEDRQNYRVALAAFLDDLGEQLCENCRIRKDTNIMRVFDCKVPSDIALFQNAPIITDFLSPESAAEWQLIQDQLLMQNVAYSIRPTLVRGLDYYNKLVFEFVSGSLGAQNAFCGGGRYDHLVSMLGGSADQPCIGAAIGVERLLLVLEAQKQDQQLTPKPALITIMPLAPAQQPLALLVARNLRDAGHCVETMVDGNSLKSMLRAADKLGTKYAVIIGESEQMSHTVQLKNMMTGESESVKQIELADRLRK